MKFHDQSQIRVDGLLAFLFTVGVALAVFAEQPQPEQPKNVAPKFSGANVRDARITAIDVHNKVLKVAWPYDTHIKPYLVREIVVTKATQFKREEKGLKLGDIKVGDVLLEVRNDHLKGRRGNAYFSAQSLLVMSLNPLTLDIQGSSSWSSPGAQAKPGQTGAQASKQALIDSLTSDEVQGIGVYLPHRSWRDPETGKWHNSTTLALKEPNNMTFTRSTPAQPVTIDSFSIRQRIAFDGTTRPDGKMNANIIWLIVAQHQPPKKERNQASSDKSGLPAQFKSGNKRDSNLKKPPA